MARPRGARFKVARALGVNVYDHPKAMKRGVKTRRKMSEYGKQLLEKQKLKAYYDMMEKQFRIYVKQALNSQENPGEKLVQRLEQRLDNLVYRLGFGSSLRQSRQMVVHGHILVDGKKADRPSMKINPGQIISLREKSRTNDMFKDNFKDKTIVLPYLEKNVENYSGSLVRIPNRDEVPIEVTDSYIIEFYSK